MTLQLEHVGFRYPGSSRLVLDDLSCAFDPGKVSVIVGPNAAGKTTLLRILAGVAVLKSGIARLDDQNLRTIKARERAKRIAYMAQRPTLAAGFTVAQTLALGRYALGPDPGSIERAMKRTEIDEMAEQGFHTLSAGQQQRVMLARALAQLDPWGAKRGSNPSRFLIADEPTSAMDPRHSIMTASLLQELTTLGIGVVVSLHDLTAAVRLADRAVVLGAAGKVAASGDVSQTLVPDILEPIYGVPFVVTPTPVGSVVTPVALDVPLDHDTEVPE